jgi:adenylate cyclase
MKFSIRTLLTVPFLLQLFLTVGFVGYFSYTSGQESVEQVVKKLRDETSKRIYQRVQLYLTTPHIINELNYSAYAINTLDLNDTAALERQFYNQINSFQRINTLNAATNELNESVNNIYFGKADGTLHGAEYNEEDQLTYIMRADETTGGFLDLLVADDFGRPTETRRPRDEDSSQIYNATNRPWYKDAQRHGARPYWSRIYGDFTATASPVITATRPVYVDGTLIGVFASDLLFSEVNDFLENLNISENGKAFLVDRRGAVLSLPPQKDSSPDPSENAQENEEPTPSDTNTENPPPETTEPSTASAVEDSTREPVFSTLGNTGNLLIDSVAACLSEKEVLIDQIQEDSSFDCQSQNSFFLQVLPIRDQYGLDWLIFAAIPESDFMEQIYENRKNTLTVLLFSLAVATAFGLLTARWLSQPVLRLKESAALLSESIAQDLPAVEVSNPSELGALAQSFQRMAEQLKSSFERQAALNRAYGRFVPKKLVEILEKDITEVELGDDVEQEGMTILFADIRDFTSLSEGMKSPKENFDFVNAYLSQMEPAITANDGFIDKYIGDAIMAVFPNDTNAAKALDANYSASDTAVPGDSPSGHYKSADSAVRAGILMLEKLDKYNKSRTTRERKEIKIGIGINTGKMMLGTVGGPSRMDGTVISDEVNLASRLESLTKRFGVSLMISSKTLEALSDKTRYHYRFLGAVRVKGRSKSVEVYEVFDGDSNNIIRQKLAGKPHFEKAIYHYQSKAFVEAKILFEKALGFYAADKAALFYIERCNTYLERGVPADWTGVEEFAEK